jgi:hypothetical protein
VWIRKVMASHKILELKRPEEAQLTVVRWRRAKRAEICD